MSIQCFYQPDHAESTRYVSSILESTRPGVDQVTIEPDGKWVPVSSTPTTRRNETRNAEVDDDIIEITGQASRGTAPLPTPSSQTPVLSSREASINSASRSSGTKRSYSAVIDLTMSSDEDEAMPRDTKRHSILPWRPQESQTHQASTSASHVAASALSRPPMAHIPSNGSIQHLPQHAYDFGFPR